MDRKWKTSFLTILGYQTMDSDQVIRSLRGLGYEGIEWTAVGHFDPDRPLSELRQLVERTREAGMEVSQVMDHKDLISLDETRRRERIERTVRVIEAAGRCRVPAVSVLTGPSIWEEDHVRIGEDMSESNAWAQAIEAFDAFTEAAQAGGIVITSEAVYGMLAHDFYTHRYLLDKVDHPAHKINFDPSHHVLYGIERYEVADPRAEGQDRPRPRQGRNWRSTAQQVRVPSAGRGPCELEGLLRCSRGDRLPWIL